jgi:kynurenine formamidase
MKGRRIVSAFIIVAMLLIGTVGLAWAQEPGMDYVIQPGDTLGKIATKYLGVDDYYTKIVEATNAKHKTDPSYALVEDPAKVSPGWKIWIPGATAAGAPAAAPSSQPLWQTLATLKAGKFVDLTHAFEPGIPHWPGFPDETVTQLYGFNPGEGTLGSGFFAQEYCHVGQWGTHVDPPAHFSNGGRTVDQIEVTDMILPLVVFDVHEKVAANPDYQITMDDVKAWEAKYGPVPEGAFVAMRTDWSKRWPDIPKMQNKDDAGVFHYPGWSMDVLKYLYEQRKITASGHETTDTDPGLATTKDDYSLETYILTSDHFQIELLANLDQVPEAGAIAVVAFPKPKGGSGFPARVFAILP